MIHNLKNLVKYALEKLFGYKLVRYSYNSFNRNHLTNLNIGSGSKNIDGFINLDLTSEWYSKRPKGYEYINYNIITDEIPFADDIVDNIYCSHVMEHLENKHVGKLFNESYRVLKPKGVFRVVVPDADFIWHVSSFKNEYWRWREVWFKQYYQIEDTVSLNQCDFLIREIATPKLKYNFNKIENYIETVNFEDDKSIVLSRLCSGLKFRADYPGEHINYWNYDKICELGRKVGFAHIILSKYQGSVSLAMTGNDIDTTSPNISLYVDLVK